MNNIESIWKKNYEFAHKKIKKGVDNLNPLCYTLIRKRGRENEMCNL